MGPISFYNSIPEWLSLLIAFLIGTGFGFALEQAGFSSSRKLAGMFYGYDTTVLKVFFTAAIVALIGSQLLSYFGLLDLTKVFVNEYYVKASIVGGVIMGAGFIMGGYCPGTGLCAMAIEAMPTKGWPISASDRPSPRRKARCGARSSPSTVTREGRIGITFFGLRRDADTGRLFYVWPPGKLRLSPRLARSFV